MSGRPLLVPAPFRRRSGRMSISTPLRRRPMWLSRRPPARECRRRGFTEGTPSRWSSRRGAQGREPGGHPLRDPLGRRTTAQAHPAAPRRDLGRAARAGAAPPRRARCRSRPAPVDVVVVAAPAPRGRRRAAHRAPRRHRRRRRCRSSAASPPRSRARAIERLRALPRGPRGQPRRRAGRSSSDPGADAAAASTDVLRTATGADASAFDGAGVGVALLDSGAVDARRPRPPRRARARPRLLLRGRATASSPAWTPSATARTSPA